MTKPVTNVAASVRDRLLADTKRKRGNFQLALRRYVVERFLYRLGQSEHREHFVLEGAMLFVRWDTSIDRPTKDLDLAGSGLMERVQQRTAVAKVCRSAGGMINQHTMAKLKVAVTLDAGLLALPQNNPLPQN